MARQCELNLHGEDGKLNQFRRPRIWVEIDPEPYNPDCNVCIGIDAQWGQPSRYIELTPDEARMLAAQLLAVADVSVTQAA